MNMTHTADAGTAAGCPVDHSQFYSHRKTGQHLEPGAAPIRRNAKGVWQITDHTLARKILRGAGTQQAGFGAHLIIDRGTLMKLPVLYQEGPAHLHQRKQTARFFTPTFTSTHYRALMDQVSDEMLATLHRKGQVDLHKLSMQMAVTVVAQVVGLTNSRLPGLSDRLDAFFAGDVLAPPTSPKGILRFVSNQFNVLRFLWVDVRPAIAARKKAPKEDVISHLIESGYNDAEILTECITYAAAGMATTREFICIAAWHFLEQPQLRQRYLAAGEEERIALLQEILRLEPVVGALKRKATERIDLTHAGETFTIQPGEAIELDLVAINEDLPIVGEKGDQICPGRPLHGDKITPPVMAFGDGHHRCPGAYIAMQESDIFLRKLLAEPTLRLIQPPDLGYSELVKGYEIRELVIGVDKRG
jgi:cytochrome P450